jgi:hypothetical protein
MSLDDDARERLGDDAVVTRDGPHIFIYVGSETAAAEAERVARETLAADGVAGTVVVTRWHEAEGAWKDRSDPMPETAGDVEDEHRRHELEAEHEARRTGHYDWWVRVDLHSLHDAGELRDRLEGEGHPVKRRWRHVLVGAATEDAAAELGESIRALAPENAEITVEAHGIDAPLYVFLEARTPGAARDLGR